MKVSIFKNLTFATGVDHSEHPDCIKVTDVDFNVDTEVLEVSGNGDEIVVSVIEKQKPKETPEEKHSRVKSMIITGDMENIDLEGELFSDFEIGEIITARVFGGNPHAEKALTNKVLAVTLSLLQGVEMTTAMSEKIAEATAKKAEVDAVRNLFNLGNL